MNKLGTILILCLIEVLLTACGSSLTAFPIPSETVNPTSTATETPSVTATTMPTRTPWPTIDATKVVAAFEDYPEENAVISTFEAPNGQWEAVLTKEYGLHFEGDEYFYWQIELRVYAVNGIVEYRPFFTVFRSMMGGDTLEILDWSTSTNSLYFGRTTFVDGAGTFPFFSEVYRLDLNTGVVTSIPVDILGAASVSPRGDFFVALCYLADGYLVTIQSLRSNQQTTLDLAIPCSGQAGGIVWSPNRTKFAINVFQWSCSEGVEDDLLSIIVVDVEALNYETIYRSDPEDLYLLDWREDGLLVESRYTQDDRQFLMDPQSGEFMPLP